MTVERRPPRRQTCTDHCSTCGRHFHGLEAFDAHRREFRCIDPIATTGRRALTAWTEEGWCDLLPGCYEDGQRVRWEFPVTIWQIGRNAGRTVGRQELTAPGGVK